MTAQRRAIMDNGSLTKKCFNIEKYLLIAELNENFEFYVNKDSLVKKFKEFH
jgi:hypothetical protein